MARKRTSASQTPTGAITAARSARFFRLLRLLDDGPKSRRDLLRHLRIDVRGFYRDLERLRELGVLLRLHGHLYRLSGTFERAIACLPLPDPQLNLQEAIALSRGKTLAHRKLRQRIAMITGTSPSSRAE